jgi:hypothetical protein
MKGIGMLTIRRYLACASAQVNMPLHERVMDGCPSDRHLSFKTRETGRGRRGINTHTLVRVGQRRSHGNDNAMSIYSRLFGLPGDACFHLFSKGIELGLVGILEPLSIPVPSSYERRSPDCLPIGNTPLLSVQG